MDWKKGGVILSLSLVFLLIGVLSANAEYCGDTYNEAVYNGPLEVGCNVDSLCEWNAGTQICVSKSQPSVPVQPIVAPADSAGSNSNDAYCQSLVQSVSDSSIAQGMCNNNPKCTWKNFKCVGKETQSQLPTERSTLVQVEEGEQPEQERTSQQGITSPSNLQASLSNNNVILTWRPATVTTTSGIGSAGAAVLENQITGNAGFFDSIANFFRNLFGIGTRGALTQSQLTYDVWRDGSVIQTGIKCTSSCSYTDNTAQQGKDYTYKVGARLSTTSSPSDSSVKFSNEASINIPSPDAAAKAGTTVQPTAPQSASAVCNTYSAAQCPADKCKPIGSGCTDKICTDYNANSCPTGPTDKCQISGSGCVAKAGTTVQQTTPQSPSAACNTYLAAQCPADKCKLIGSGCTDKICTDYNANSCPTGPTDKCQISGSGCVAKAGTTVQQTTPQSASAACNTYLAAQCPADK